MLSRAQFLSFACCYITLLVHCAHGTVSPPSGSSARSVEDAGDSHLLAGRWSVREDGTVLDAKTRLLWTQVATKQTTFDKDTWAQANAYCSSLNLSGYSDWRLPTVNDLRSLLSGCNRQKECGNLEVSCEGCKDCTEHKGPGEGGCYWDTGVWQGRCWLYWTLPITGYTPDGAEYGCVVDFSTGQVDCLGLGTVYGARARCVRP